MQARNKQARKSGPGQEWQRPKPNNEPQQRPSASPTASPTASPSASLKSLKSPTSLKSLKSPTSLKSLKSPTSLKRLKAQAKPSPAQPTSARAPGTYELRLKLAVRPRLLVPRRPAPELVAPATGPVAGAVAPAVRVAGAVPLAAGRGAAEGPGGG
jgi:hypothetical protein